jgi:hypothetical protein
VVVNDQGQYGRPEIKAEPPQTQHQQQQQPQQQQRSRSISTEPRPALPGSQARREAIEAAARTLPARGLQRSTSSVSTGAMGGGGGLTAGPSRMLSRSISTGQQVFQRAPRTSTSGALSPIPQSSQSQESAGATARRTALALEAERVRLEAADAEIAALRSRVQEMSGAGLLDVAKLQRELYAAQGQVQIVRDNQAQEAARFREDIRRLKEANNGLEQAARDKEAEYKTRLESMRTQAVFSVSPSQAGREEGWCRSDSRITARSRPRRKCGRVST